MGKSPDIPEGPDPEEVIRSQAEFNRVNAFTPFGSVQFSTPPGGATNTQVGVTLPERQQQIVTGQRQAGVETTQGALGRTQQINEQTPLSFDNLPQQIARVDQPGGAQRVQSQSGDLATETPAFLGNIQTGVNSRSRDIQQNLDPRTENIRQNVDPRTGEVQQNVDPLTGEVQRAVSLEGAQALPGVNDGFGNVRQRVEDAQFNRARRLLDPQFEQQEQELRQTLANQGLPSTGGAFQNEFDDFQRQRSRALEDAAFRAVQTGGQEQQRLFNQALSARQQEVGERFNQGQFENQATQQVFQQGLNAGQFQNQAAQQRFGQDLASGQFQNQAVQQAFNQDLNAGQFQNQAVQQAFGQDLSAGQFRNQAANQLFGQALGANQFENQAVQQQQALDTQAAQTNNAIQQQLFGQNLANAQLQNQGRQQGVNETLAQRNQPFQELSTLLNSAPAPRTPNFQATPVDVQGPFQAQANRQTQGAVAANQAQSGFFGNLIGAGGALGAAALSDRRTKRDIVKIGDLPNGLNLYKFKFIEGEEEHIGVMSDEVRKVMPRAVRAGPDGFDRVDYAQVFNVEVNA